MADVTRVVAIGFVAVLHCWTLSNGQTSPDVSNLQSTLSCSFDRGFCGWKNEGFHFSQATDLTSGGFGEGFALARTSAQLTSGWRWLKNEAQLFFYFFVHPDLDNFAVIAEDFDGTQKVLWRLTGGNRTETAYPEPIPSYLADTDNGHNGRWIPARVNLCLTGQFRLIFNVSNRIQTEFALDQIIIHEEAKQFSHASTGFECPTETPYSFSASTVTCDSLTPHVTTMCGWRVADVGGMEVNVDIREVPGLALDEPAGRQYAFVVTPLRVNETVRGVITSSFIFSRNPSGMFSFWYIMRGPRTTVNVHVQQRPTIATFGHRDRWNLMTVDVPMKDETGMIIIHVTFGAPENPTDEPETRFADNAQMDDPLFAITEPWFTTEPAMCSWCPVFAPGPQTDVGLTTATSAATVQEETTPHSGAVRRLVGELAVILFLLFALKNQVNCNDKI